MKVRTIIGLALVCVLCVFGLAGPQTGPDYFQKALSKEKAEGNLLEAISLYQKAITASKDEALAAQAQLQIGICYEKLGLREAEKAFRLVVDKYPRQSGTVQEARERLQRLAGLAAGPEAASGGLSLRKLDMPVGTPSPDGRYIVANGDSEDMFLYDIEAKQKKTIRPFSSESGFLISAVSWAPDSRRFACIWRSPQRYNELWIWTLGENAPRLVCSDHQVDLGNIPGWSPDQSWIYVQYYEKKRSVGFPKAFGRISVSSGQLEKICDLPLSQFNMRLSPDGRHMAFNIDPTPQDHDIRIMTTDGSKQTVLLKHQGDVSFLNWTSDGKYIIFTSRNTAQKELWLMRVNNGQREGSSVSIHLFGAAVISADTTRAGSLFVATELSGQDACTAQIDLTSGELVRPVQVIDPETMGRTTTPFWSKDGGEIAYFYQRDDDLTTRYRYDHLKIKSTASGRVNDYKLDFLADPRAGQPRWSADGKSILILGIKSDVLGLFAFDLSQKTSRILLQDRDICAFTADGKIIYLDRMVGKKLPEAYDTLIRKDLTTGGESIIYSCAPGEGIGRVMLSPADSMIGFNSVAFMEGAASGIGVIPSDPERTLTRKDARFISGLIFFNWGPAGKGIFATRQSMVENKPAFQTVYYPEIDPAANPIPVDLSGYWVMMSFHPDGKTVAVTHSAKRGEFWSLTNYLPKK